MSFLHTHETRQKMREAWKRRRLTGVSAETRAKMSVAHKGRRFSESHKRNIALALLGIVRRGHPCSEENKLAMSLARKGIKRPHVQVKHSPENIEFFRARVTGSLNPNWKGGLTDDEERWKVKGRIYAHKRRLQEKESGTLTYDQWEAIKKFYGGQCACCGTTEDIQIDHVVPLCNGGTHTAENIQPLCGKCNMKKGRKTIRYERSACQTA